MYQYLRNMLNLADQVGHVETMRMGQYTKDMNHIVIHGTAKNGGSFTMELLIETEAEPND